MILAKVVHPNIYKTMSKVETEQCSKLSIFWLKQNKALYQGSSGSIYWGFSFGSTLRVNYFIKELSNIELCYLKALGDKPEKLIYKIKLTSTSCNYGGKRLWLICPLTTNGKYCGKRVGVLYKPDYSSYFGCRYCFKLTYKSSKLSGREKQLGKLWSIAELTELQSKIKKKLYQGKVTKRYKSYLKKVIQVENNLGELRKYIRS